MSKSINLTTEAKSSYLVDQVFDEQVDFVGNWGFIAARNCIFRKGFRAVAKDGFAPNIVVLTGCNTSPSNSTGYPLKINGAKIAIIDDVTCSGNRLAYSRGGSPDQFSINNVEEVYLDKCLSEYGGENGYSINGCRSVIIKNSEARHCDGQGWHIGRHVSGVANLTMIKAKSLNNWKNQIGATGSGCGVLLHNVLRAVIDIYSEGHEYTASHMNKTTDGRLILRGASRDLKKLISSANIKSAVNLEVLQ